MGGGLSVLTAYLESDFLRAAVSHSTPGVIGLRKEGKKKKEHTHKVYGMQNPQEASPRLQPKQSSTWQTKGSEAAEMEEYFPR